MTMRRSRQVSPVTLNATAPSHSYSAENEASFRRAVEQAMRDLSQHRPLTGTTANRPTNLLRGTQPVDVLIGSTYFDTTLGIPVWWDGTNWVDATGATV